MTLKQIMVFLSLCVPFFFGTIWAIVDAGRRDFGTIGRKIAWSLVAAVPFVGFIVYLLFGLRRGKIPPQEA